MLAKQKEPAGLEHMQDAMRGIQVPFTAFIGRIRQSPYPVATF